MSLFTSNRFLVAVLIVGLGTAAYSIPALLQQIKDAARAPLPEASPPTKRLQKDSEDLLKIETLRTLADGYSYELRTSAIKIVASRTVRCRAKHLLLRDLASRDYRRRDDAINALHMIIYHPALSDTKVASEFQEPEALKAVVRALINVLPLHNVDAKEKSKSGQQLPPSPVRPHHRPAHEASLLHILSNMLHHVSRRSSRQSASATMEAALQAGLVTRWLANYPFPCALPENSGFNFKKSDVVRLFDRMTWLTDDPLMADIVLEVMQYALGRKQMRDAGLQASSYKENVDRDTWDSRWASSRWAAGVVDDPDVRMIGGEDTAGLAARDDVTVWGETFPPVTMSSARLRSSERSQEEEHLRRRHREAIVVAERGAPLRRENILQRENSRILQPMDGVSEVEGVLNGLLGLSDGPGQALDSPTSSSSLPELLDQVALAVAGSEGREAAEFERALDVQEIELMIEQSLQDPELRRAIETLGQSSGSVTLLLTDTGEGSETSTREGEGESGEPH